jgi:hypothetical protein
MTDPVRPVERVIAWVKAEHARHQLPLPPKGCGTRANLSLADALLLVDEIERLRAVQCAVSHVDEPTGWDVNGERDRRRDVACADYQPTPNGMADGPDHECYNCGLPKRAHNSASATATTGEGTAQ